MQRILEKYYLPYVKDVARFAPCAWNLGDECSFIYGIGRGPKDRPAYNEFLKRKYGSVAKYNEVHETNITDFAQAAHPNMGAALKSGDWAGWCDTREFSEYTYAQAFQLFRRIIKKVDPKARVGAEGSSAGDLELTVKNLEFWGPYRKLVDDELLRCIAPNTLRGIWWGGYFNNKRDGYPLQMWEKMLDSYFEALSSYVSVDRELFEERFRIFRLFRYLQILGAYGFRGWIEQKANFVVSIPAALQCLEELLSGPFDRYPYLTSVLKEMIALPRFHDHHVEEGRLEVKVCSFSFKKGIPQDPTGNGGGYVFDCRSIHNPGRYEPYKKLTGRDEPVIRFLEDDGEIVRFLEHVYAVVVPHVRTYSERGFNSLMVSFGCTGGQHRSVYCAEHLARHIAELFPDVAVRLTHREQHINESFNI